jgi:hypothetical protein
MQARKHALVLGTYTQRLGGKMARWLGGYCRLGGWSAYLATYLDRASERANDWSIDWSLGKDAS